MPKKRDWEHRFIIPPLHHGIPISHGLPDGSFEDMRRKDAKELILQVLCGGHSMMPFANEEVVQGRLVKFVDIYCFKFEPKELDETKVVQDE
jgi:hypothetical protein